MQVAGIRSLTVLSVLGNDPEVVGAPNGWDPIFDHLPEADEAYLGLLNVGGLLDDHLKVIKQGCYPVPSPAPCYPGPPSVWRPAAFSWLLRT